MNKKASVFIGIVVVVVIVVGGYAIFHKSPKATLSTNSSTQKSTAVAVNNAVLVTKTDSKLGQYLATPSGKPLYTYGGDSADVSNVTGSLLASWPAYVDTGSTTGLPTNVGTIKRTDNGQTQYTYKGLPLYTFVDDSQGQVTGNGVSDFTIATPATAAKSSSSTSSSTGSSTQSTSNSSSNNPY